MNKIKIKDVPVGVLLIVLSLFCVYGVMYLSGFPSLLHLIGIVLLSIICSRLVNVGADLISGIEVNVKKDD